jgi:hypothetical protein
MRVTFSSQEAPIMPFRLMLQSDFGVGKTWLIGYIDNKLKELTGRGLLYFDFDLGWQTHRSAVGEDRKPLFNVSTISYLMEPGKLGVAFEEFDEDFHKYTRLEYLKQYSGFAIDSLTSLQACAMDYVFSENKIKRRMNMANENDYGVLVNVMTQLMPQILEIGRYAAFILATHTRERTNKDTGQTSILPAVTGKSLPSQIGGWFNEVWYLRPEGYGAQINNIAQTRAGNSVSCKTQTADMPYELSATAAVDKIMEAYKLKDLKVPEVTAEMAAANKWE